MNLVSSMNVKEIRNELSKYSKKELENIIHTESGYLITDYVYNHHYCFSLNISIIIYLFNLWLIVANSLIIIPYFC